MSVVDRRKALRAGRLDKHERGGQECRHDDARLPGHRAPKACRKTAETARRCAAAIGTWPISSVQPLSAPIDESTTAIEIAIAPQGPHIIRAASENGATRLHQLLARQHAHDDDRAENIERCRDRDPEHGRAGDGALRRRARCRPERSPIRGRDRRTWSAEPARRSPRTAASRWG